MYWESPTFVNESSSCMMLLVPAKGGWLAWVELLSSAPGLVQWRSHRDLPGRHYPYTPRRDLEEVRL